MVLVASEYRRFLYLSWDCFHYNGVLMRYCKGTFWYPMRFYCKTNSKLMMSTPESVPIDDLGFICDCHEWVKGPDESHTVMLWFKYPVIYVPECGFLYLGKGP
jgi:hypothetical protein